MKRALMMIYKLLDFIVYVSCWALAGYLVRCILDIIL